MIPKTSSSTKNSTKSISFTDPALVTSKAVLVLGRKIKTHFTGTRVLRPHRNHSAGYVAGEHTTYIFSPICIYIRSTYTDHSAGYVAEGHITRLTRMSKSSVGTLSTISSSRVTPSTDHVCMYVCVYMGAHVCMYVCVYMRAG
jgi:hypothetical protein